MTDKKVDHELANSLVVYAHLQLEDALSTIEFKPSISAETSNCVRKRVPRKAICEYSAADKILSLIINDLQNFGERIRLYPFTARYREEINSSSRDMFIAWQLHSHVLRQSELYIIQERGTEILQFLYFASRDFGIESVDRSNIFEKGFKKRFERRLRERHRLVHAHEKPSLTSRVIDLMVGVDDMRAVGQTLAELAVKITSVLPDEIADYPEEPIHRLRSLGKQYASFAEKEALDMFILFSDAVISTLTGAPAVRT